MRGMRNGREPDAAMGRRGNWRHRLGVENAAPHLLREQALRAFAGHTALLSRFFQPGGSVVRAHNELTYRGRTDGTTVRRIDRLVEFENEVWVLDYKAQVTVAQQPVDYATQQVNAVCCRDACAVSAQGGARRPDRSCLGAADRNLARRPGAQCDAPALSGPLRRACSRTSRGPRSAASASASFAVARRDRDADCEMPIENSLARARGSARQSRP